MDLDRYIQRNDATWRRLENLTKNARKLSGEDLSELVTLYPRVAADLSHARTHYRDPELNARLSGIVGNANSLIHAAPRKSRPKAREFFAETFPAAVWSARWFMAASALLLFVPAVGMGLWLHASGSTLDAAVPPEMQRLIAEHEFRDYYSSQAAGDFSVMVMLNNIKVAMLAFGLGVVPIVGTAWILITNGVNVGVMGAVMHQAGEARQFWTLIAPHGILELTSVAIAGGAGLRLSWSLIAPGDQTRLAAFSREGIRSVVIAGGLCVSFAVAALLEAFITPSRLPDMVRIGLGASVGLAFIAYIVVLGSIAQRNGITGHPRSTSQPTGALDPQIHITEL